MPTLRWNEHSAQLTYLVSELYKASDLTDCILDVEGKLIQVHKTIIGAFSPYFKKLLKNHHAITLIPMKDVLYKDMKLILDFIYNGEADVNITDVSSIIKTAELLEMTSLKQSVWHCFGEELSNETSARSINKRPTVSCTNLIRRDAKKEQVQHNSPVLYMRDERFISKSQNIQMQSTGDCRKKCFNDFKEVLGKSNEDEPKGIGLNTSDRFKNVENLDEEIVNDELVPITFVAVSEIKGPIEVHQDNQMCYDSALRDPLVESSGVVNVSNKKNVREECTLQNRVQVKMEPNYDIEVPEPLSEEVIIPDNLTHSFEELTSSNCKEFVSCDQEGDRDSKPDVIISNANCNKGCASEETDDLKIKFEDVCDVSGADVKEDNVFESCHFSNHSVHGGDTASPPLECEGEMLKRDAQHFSSILHQLLINDKKYDADTSISNTSFLSQLGNQTPGVSWIRLANYLFYPFLNSEKLNALPGIDSVNEAIMV